MGDGALGSDHVNYLILRYLQESGFENAAKSLYREWNRNDQFRDPEALPFAHVVKQQELVHIIQDGLYHDQLQAEVVNTPRRFQLTSLDPQIIARPAKVLSRRQSVYASRDADEFPVPQAKRTRHSNASEVVTNGDAMEVDDKADDDDGMTATSEVRSEPGAPAIETKAVATQTDKKKRKAKTRTIYWTLDKSLPIVILHALWNPNTDTGAFLLTAGESMCRLYNLASPDGQTIESTDAFDMSAEHVVTAATWHPTGEYFTCAVKGPSQMAGIIPGKNYLVDVNVSGETNGYDNWFDMITVALRYSKSGNTLFAASTDGARSVLEARDLTSEDHRKWVAAYEYVQENVILDVACISDTSFAVCGKGLVSVWSLGPAPQEGDAAERALQLDYTHPVSADIGFDKVRYDQRHQVLVAVATSSGDICTLRRDTDTWTLGPDIAPPDVQGPSITSVVFQPQIDETPSTDPSNLAIAFRTGEVAIYHITSTTCTPHVVLTMGPREEALALSWSPSDSHLAAGSDEAIKVWDVTPSPAKELLAWKAAPANWYQGDDNHLPDDEDARMEPTLGWDTHGQRLAFAVGRKDQKQGAEKPENIVPCWDGQAEEPEELRGKAAAGAPDETGDDDEEAAIRQEHRPTAGGGAAGDADELQAWRLLTKHRKNAGEEQEGEASEQEDANEQEDVAEREPEDDGEEGMEVEAFHCDVFDMVEVQVSEEIDIDFLVRGQGADIMVKHDEQGAVFHFTFTFHVPRPRR